MRLVPLRWLVGVMAFRSELGNQFINLYICIYFFDKHYCEGFAGQSQVPHRWLVGQFISNKLNLDFQFQLRRGGSGEGEP